MHIIRRFFKGLFNIGLAILEAAAVAFAAAKSYSYSYINNRSMTPHEASEDYGLMFNVILIGTVAFFLTLALITIVRLFQQNN